MSVALRRHEPHQHVHVALAARTDPTRSATLRRRFAGAIARRFRAFKAELRQAVLDNRLRIFQSDADRLDELETFVEASLAAIVLEARPDRPGVRWTDPYIAQAAAQAANQAETKMHRAGFETDAAWTARGGEIQAAGARPAEVAAIRERVAGLQREVWGDLRGIVSAVQGQIMQQAAQGFREGVAPSELMRRFSDRIEKVGVTRGRVLADVSVVTTHADVTLDRFEQMGVEEVIPQVEFTTAGDSRVCPICEALGGSTWRIEAARGLIPVHPRCRCSWQLSSREPPPRAPESQPFDVPREERINPSPRRIDERRRIISERLNSPEERRIREWLDSVRDRIPDDPEERVRRLLDNWVRGSSRKVSVELETAAQREFGLPGMVYSKRPVRLSEANIRQSQADVRRIWRATQDFYRAQGIREITVYRGVKSPTRVPGAVESWTTNRAVAESFDGHEVLKMTVPVERVLAAYNGPLWRNGPYGQQFEVLVMSDAPSM